MKTIYLRRSLWLAAILLTSLCAGAQTKTKPKTAYQVTSNDMYYRIHNDGDNRIEDIKTEYDDKIYKVEYVNEKLTSLSVDGVKIPESDWSKYSEATAHIREEMREMAKRNAEQAKRNAEQAVRNEEQAKRNAEQVTRNQEQAKRNDEQAKINAEQQKRNAEQAVRNQEQAKRDAEQVGLNEIQAKKNAEQAVRNKEQEKRNAEQAVRNQEQAKRNAEQAKAMEQLMKEISTDLANDKIIKDRDDLRQLSFGADGMTVNGIKQPEDVFKKYRKKYSKEKYGILYHDFNYSRDGIIIGH